MFAADARKFDSRLDEMVFRGVEIGGLGG